MTTNYKKSIAIFLMTLSAFSLQNCSKEDSDDEKKNDTSLQLDNYIRNMEEPLQDNPTDEPEQIGDVLTEIDKENQTYCECTKYKATEGYNELMLLDPTTNTIYPGSILDGNSVLDGSYRQIVLDRAPMDISTNLQFFEGSPKRTVENPTLSNVRTQIKEMIYDANITGSTAAKITYEIQEIYSADQLNLAIGAGVNAKKVDISSKFNFDSKTTRSRFLLKFIQVYYTIDVDAPSSPSKFFADNVTATDLNKALNGNNTVPVYVSSVQYGRLAYYAIESSERADSVKANLEAEIEAGVADVSTSTNICTSSYTKNLTISGTIIGGSGEDAVQSVTGKDGLIKYITEGGDFSKDSPGAPIAYTLTKLSDNRIFNVVNASEYVAKKCKSVSGSVIPVSIYGVTGDDNDLYGKISATLGYDNGEEGEPIYFFNKLRKDSVSVDAGKTRALSSDDESEFNIDYQNFDNAYIIIKAELKDNDMNQDCSCSSIIRDANNDESYDVYEKKFYLKKIKDGDYPEIDEKNGQMSFTVEYEDEVRKRHESCGFGGYDTCHEHQSSKQQSKVRITIKFNNIFL